VLRTILANTGWHNCQLLNPTDESMVLGAGTFIGQLTPLADIVSIAQKNAPAAAKIDAPCYLTGNQGQGDYQRPNNYRNKHKRYSADRVRASQTNFPPDRNNGRMQNSYSRSNSFAQNDRGTNIENHHHQNHSDSPTPEPLIKHTYGELKICLTIPAITPEQQLKFRALIDEFGDIFAVNISELTGTDRLKITINIQLDARPIRQRPYSYSQEARVEIERQIQEMLAIKFMRHSIFPWASNVLLAKKNSNEQRFCIDYRALNKCIRPEVHAVPSFSSIHGTLSYAKPVIFSSLDLRSSFYPVIVDDDSIKYTAFQSHLGQFEFLRAPFSIKTILFHLKRAMSLFWQIKRAL